MMCAKQFYRQKKKTIDNTNTVLCYTDHENGALTEFN